MKSKTSAFIAAISVQIIYGFTFTFANDVIDAGIVQPYAFIVLRTSISCLLFWIVSLFMPSEKIDRKDYKTFLWAAFFGMNINMLSFFKGLEFTSPIHGSVIMTAVPIMVLILSSIYLKEQISKKKVFGIGLGLTGAVVLSVYGKASKSGDNILLGNSLILINAISYAIYLIFIKKLTHKYHPVTFIKWLFLIGTILNIPFGYNELLEIKLSSFNYYSLFSVAFVVLGATFGTYLLNPLALRQLKASTVGTFLYLQPFVATLFSIAIGSDFLDEIKILAAVLIFTGVFLVSSKVKPTIKKAI
jgi:drug/metabolite transporter (DMT)-like permease